MGRNTFFINPLTKYDEGVRSICQTNAIVSSLQEVMEMQKLPLGQLSRQRREKMLQCFDRRKTRKQQRRADREDRVARRRAGRTGRRNFKRTNQRDSQAQFDANVEAEKQQIRNRRAKRNQFPVQRNLHQAKGNLHSAKGNQLSAIRNSLAAKRK